MFLRILMLSLLGFVSFGSTAQAQVTSNQPSTVVSDTPAGHFVSGGQAEGANLFHSLSQLNTDDSRQLVNFIVSPIFTPGIERVITRVTDSPTVINGAITITSDGMNLAPGIDLFLLSPKGLSLGPNAITNIDGAFVGTTAAGLTFADGTLFRADTDEAPLLTVSIPVGLQLGPNPASVQVQGLNASTPLRGLNTLFGSQNALLIGGDIDISGDINLVTGRLQLAGLTEEGTVALTRSGALGEDGILRAVLPGGANRADVTITGGATVLANGPVESVSVSAHDFTMAGNSSLLSGVLAVFPVPYKVGDINIDTTGQIQLTNSFIYNANELGAVGDIGNINIAAQSMYLTDSAQIGTIGQGTGDIGSLNIKVTEDILLDGRNSRLELLTGLYSLTGTFLQNTQSSGQTGDVNIEAGSLRMIEGALLSASTLGEGDAGDLTIIADSVVVSGSYEPNGVASSISSSVELTAVGNGGNVEIVADDLTLSQGGYITGRTQGSGDAGNISLIVNTLDATEGGKVVATSATEGNAGNISITARDRIQLSGTDDTYNSRVAISPFNSSGGADSGIYANTSPTATGSGGNATVQTGTLSLEDGAQITASSQGTGAAGSLEISAVLVRLGDSKIQAESRGGSEGNVSITTPVLVLRDQSQITTNATETATGGNITLNAPLIVGADNSDIVARATQGTGGSILVESDGLFGIAARPQLTERSDINASSDLGVDGTVAIKTPTVDPDNGLVELPANPADSSDQLARSCSSADGQFIATGRGGLPSSPLRYVESYQPWQDLRAIAPQRESTSSQNTAEITDTVTASAETPTETVSEAGSWNISESGEVVLAAAVSNPNPQLLADCLGHTASK